MTGFLTIAKKEFRSYFTSPVGFVFIIAFIATSNWLYFSDLFLNGGEAEMRSWFFKMPVFFIIFIPAITMRMWSEERKLGTAEILLTLPLRETEIVLGKFAAACGFLALTLALTFPTPMTLKSLGEPDMGLIWSGYLGAFLLGAACIAIGFFSSSVTQDQVSAFLLGAVVIFGLWLVGEQWVTIRLPVRTAAVLQGFGLGHHFQSILRGIVDTRDVLYYLSVAAFFLFGSLTLVMQRR